ncbi:uncharacterized protein LOC115405945 isoform X2 [Salarias fasciatus]|uniref:uncharacterized protein LOC115405945 isoform X2 n=1 Tax=Salarias fasciatus TaxID=181472 RepID=UPI001176C28F|nr:uncharacterized protein LOC115405945 isoform X2 [Salarias fasciatus]
MCSVVGCDSWRRGVERFRLPEDPERRLEWVQFVLEVNGQRLKESSWTEISICCEHFAEDCLESPTVSAGEARLKSGAVPSQMEGSTEKWTDSEVRDLLHLFGCREIQRDDTRRNLKVYASISEQLALRGVHRTAKQCREKIKKLKQDYKKVKDQNIRSGYERKTNKWYEKMDAILGHRPEFAANPAAAAGLEGVIPQSRGRSPATDTTIKAEAALDGPEEGFLNEAPSTSSISTDCSTSGSPCPPPTCTSPPCLSTSSSKPSTSYTSQPSSPLPRPARKRKREEPSLQRLVKQLLQKDEEDRRTSQKTMNQLLAMLKEQNAREAEERERQRAEAAEERRRQDTFHKLLGMLLLRLTETSQQPTHPTLD